MRLSEGPSVDGRCGPSERVSYPATPTKFIHAIGWRGVAIFWWGPDDACNGFHHTIRHELRRGDGPKPEDNEIVWGGYREWMPDVGAPCSRCGSPFPGADVLPESEIRQSASSETVWDTESGDLEPGSMYWSEWYPHELGNCPFNDWSNCDGRHLHVVLPNKHSWDVDSRASNCTLKVRDTPCPENTETGEHTATCKCRTHRCWVRSGDPETEPVTAGKSGPTCTAGAGSILSGDYHGFLVDGVLSAG